MEGGLAIRSSQQEMRVVRWAEASLKGKKQPFKEEGCGVLQTGENNGFC